MPDIINSVKEEFINEYIRKIDTAIERPELAPIAAEWFHCKWGVPTEAYLECMTNEGIQNETD